MTMDGVMGPAAGMSEQIEDGRSLFDCGVEAWWDHPRLASPNGPKRRFGPLPQLDQVSEAEPLQARIYEGQWIVDCPCGGADFVWTDALLTVCASCGNRPLGGTWRRVVLPDERAAIERHLLARPEAWQRNWGPGETVAGLVRENAAEGIP